MAKPKPVSKIKWKTGKNIYNLNCKQRVIYLIHGHLMKKWMQKPMILKKEKRDNRYKLFSNFHQKDVDAL